MTSTNITVTRSARKKTPGAFLFMLILIALAFFAMIIKFQTDHGKRKHDRDPDLAEQCLNRHGVAYAFMEPASGKYTLFVQKAKPNFMMSFIKTEAH